MRHPIRRVVPLVLFLAAVPGFSGAAHAGWGMAGADLNFWSQELQGTLRSDTVSVTGTPINLQSTLGLDTELKVPDGRIWFGAGGTHFVVTFSESNFDGLAALQQDLTFNGNTFSNGELVNSVLDTEVVGVYYFQSILPVPLVDFGFQVGVDLIDFHAMVESSMTGIETFDETVPLPAVGLHLAVNPPAAPFRLYADLSAMSARVRGDEVHLLDGRAQVDWYWNHFVGMHAGYRLFEIEVDFEDIGRVDTRQSGPFVGMTVKF